MPLCHGTLDGYLRELEGNNESLLEPLELTEIMIQILTGLYHCHVQGYCHRDIKLSNSNIFLLFLLILSFVYQ